MEEGHLHLQPLRSQVGRSGSEKRSLSTAKDISSQTTQALTGTTFNTFPLYPDKQTHMPHFSYKDRTHSTHLEIKEKGWCYWQVPCAGNCSQSSPRGQKQNQKIKNDFTHHHPCPSALQAHLLIFSSLFLLSLVFTWLLAALVPATQVLSVQILTRNLCLSNA